MTDMLSQNPASNDEEKRDMGLIERLRAVADMDLRTGPILAHTLDTASDAADEIERLRAKNQQLASTLAARLLRKEGTQ